MCGILGLIRSDAPVDAHTFDRMLDTLHHRGPDGRGVHVLEGGRVALGHRRLAIIDLSDAGAQPMANEDETVWLTFNGEIYNFRQLRRELVRAGHRFSSQADSEVIVHAYEEWGADCLRRFRGIFAFGLWDARRKQLLLARDGAGVKPLYYARYCDRFGFASQPKALVEDPEFPRAVSPAAFGSFLSFGYVPHDQAIFRDMAKLPAGCYAVYADGRLSVQHFAVAETDRPFRDRVEAADAIDEAVRDAVGTQLVSDVPVGCFLSGGLDSTLLTAVARPLIDELRSFTVGFHERSNDERSYARAVAQHFQTTHTESVIERQELERSLWTLQDFFDEPFDSNGPLPFLEVARLARRSGTVVALGGDGADELFTGYLRYDDFDQPATRWGASRLRRALRGRGLIGPRSTAPDDLLRYFPYEGCLPQRIQRSLLGEAFVSELGDDEGAVMERFYDRRLPAVAAAQHLDVQLYLVDHILCKVDRASMAHGVEARVPYLDPAVMAAARRTPLSEHFRGGERKALLKRVARRHLPDAFVTARKKGFSTPIGQWFDAEWDAWSHDLLEEGMLVGAGIIRADWPAQLAAAPLSARAANRAKWLLIIAELWSRRWLGGAVPRFVREAA
jgi:asparagine synthase (glutamine-hydrolysing)